MEVKSLIFMLILYIHNNLLQIYMILLLWSMSIQNDFLKIFNLKKFKRNMDNKMLKKYKITILGDKDIGKTTYINRLKTGEFNNIHIPTIGVDISQLKFNTNLYGEIVFNVWDTAGEEKHGGLREGYWIGSDAFILMFDLTCGSSLINIFKYIKLLKQNNSIDKPLILCGNKCDLQDYSTKSFIDLLNKYGSGSFKLKNIYEHKFRYFSLSAKSNTNTEDPFLYIARVLLSDNNIFFTDSSPIIPPLIKIESNSSNEAKNRHEEVNNVYMKIPSNIYHMICNILNEKSDKLKCEFQQCRY